ncbi:MAG: DUF4139 domain-containing protein [Bacteroidales bacterium]|jgi:uncharacterized protein (TIGR02231 family)|nr:DUF4139 domain-containing protein [Bacteroidales bacterium]
MKKQTLLPAGILMIAIVFHFRAMAQQPVPVASNLTDVTVFLNGALVSREGSVSLEPGTRELLFSGLPAEINAQSVQVQGTGNITILSVNYQINYLKSPEENQQIKVLKDSLQLLQNMVNLKKSALTVCDEEEAFLKSNRSIGGTNTGVNIADLKAADEFIRARFAETGRLRISLSKEISDLNEQITRISNQLNNLSNLNQPTGEVRVKIMCPSKTKASLRLSYLVNNASWTPEYDLRAEDPSKPVELVYKGSIVQNTGEDWNNVHLTLSTGNPSLGGAKPELNIWFLDFYYPQPARILKSAKAEAVPETSEMVIENDEVVARGYGTMHKLTGTEPAVTGSSYTEFSENQTMALYSINLPATVPSDGKPQLVEIRKEKPDAMFIHYAAPKLDPDAFLVARITGWEKLNLLPGNANVFFEGTYTGQSYLNPGAIGDTLDVSLGRDKGINLRRERIKEFTSRQSLGSSRKDTRGFEITVRNNKKVPVSLMLQDQIPVPVNKDISVDPVEISGGNLEKQTGKITWNLKLAPSESKTLRLVYEVKYPKNRQVILE